MYAVELDTGDQLWETHIRQRDLRPQRAGDRLRQGVRRQPDRPLLGAGHQDRGHELWHWTTGSQSGAGAFQPSVFDHQVYVTTQAASSGHGADHLHSYQGRPAARRTSWIPNGRAGYWNWQVVEEGFWGHPEINSGGGHLVPAGHRHRAWGELWGSGNPSPVPGLKGWPNGSSRPGPNLYTNSLIALDHRTGKMLWYNQVKPHDLFNLDFQISPMLVTVKLQRPRSEDRHRVGQAGGRVRFRRGHREDAVEHAHRPASERHSGRAARWTSPRRGSRRARGAGSRRPWPTRTARSMH